MPIWNYICDACDKHVEQLLIHNEKENNICPACGGNLYRLPSAPHFKLAYDNKKDMVDWNGNTSRYWEEYKKQKEEGKDVRVPKHDGDE